MKSPLSLLKAARKCGESWHDNGATCHPSCIDLSADDCQYIKKKHPRLWRRYVVEGGLMPDLGSACRAGYADAQSKGG